MRAGFASAPVLVLLAALRPRLRMRVRGARTLLVPPACVERHGVLHARLRRMVEALRLRRVEMLRFRSIEMLRLWSVEPLRSRRAVEALRLRRPIEAFTGRTEVSRRSARPRGHHAATGELRRVHRGRHGGPAAVCGGEERAVAGGELLMLPLHRRERDVLLARGGKL